MHFRIVLLLSLCLSLGGRNSSLWAQSPLWDGISIAGDVYRGKTLKHRPSSMPFEIPKSATAFSIEFTKQTDGTKYWHELHGNPRIGCQFFSQRFGNDAILGRLHTLVPYIDFPLLRKPFASVYIKLSYGLAFLDTPYNRLSNQQNTAIGSYINNLTSMSLLGEIPLSSKLNLRIGGTLTHTSNAKLHVPNLGLNAAKLRLGLSYEVQPPKSAEAFDYSNYPVYKKPVVNFRFAMAFQEAKVADGPLYPVYISSVFASYMYVRKAKVLLGWEGSWERSNQEFNINQEIPDGIAQPWLRQSAYLGNEFMLGRLGLMTQVFFYLDKPSRESEGFGFKLGPNVYLFKPHEQKRGNLFFGIYLKAHKAVADYAELTLGGSF